MGHETTKSNNRRKGTWLFNKVFSGKGIDIGGGKDPLTLDGFPNIKLIESFDKGQGDAHFITKYRKLESYDFVYSSNTLEHMIDVEYAIQEWWRLVKPGGFMVITVPDEDLYEQCQHGRWTKEHNFTFTIHKRNSWSGCSINIFDLIDFLPDCQIIKMELVDTNYDYSKYGKEDQTLGDAEAFIEIVLRKQGKEELK